MALVHKVINRSGAAVEKCFVYGHLALFFKYCVRFLMQRSEFSPALALLMHNNAIPAQVVNRWKR